MPYDARQVANWFVNRAQRDRKSVSIMSLLKLVYIAHGWRLESMGGPLVHNRIEAWKYGPVIPDVYNTFRKQGLNITAPVRVPSDVVKFSEEDEDLLEQVYSIYGGLDALQLSDLTHVSGGPWDIATQTGGYYAPIPNDLIRQHYVQKRAEATKQAENA